MLDSMLSATSLPRSPFALETFLVRGAMRFLLREAQEEGVTSLAKTLQASLSHRDLQFRPDRTLGEELAIKAERYGSKPYIMFEGEAYSYQLLNDQAARIASFMQQKFMQQQFMKDQFMKDQFMKDQFMKEQPGTDNKVVGLLLPNIPAYLSIFFASQRVGATAVPINTSLKDEGLAYILNNAGIVQVYTVPSLLPELDRIRDQLKVPPQIIVVPEFKNESMPASLDTNSHLLFSEVLECKPQLAPVHDIDARTISMLMYTSGTTGYPKGVVYRYGTSQAKMTRFLAHLLIGEDDIYYTCLPLFHANALVVTAMSVLYAGATLALSRKFSARNFWQEIRDTRATAFNTLGTMIAILMKQPNDPLDGVHHVRRVVSAACPANLWEGFEKRFKVKLIESFGAVDGGGIVTMNVGNAPVGSIGRPLGNVKWRLVDDNGRDVPPGQPGELIHYVGGTQSREVDYFNNAKASAEKTRDGWVHSGDLLWRDKRNFLYFAGRNSDSMRCGGENVSALEVESAVNRFPAVLESAAFGVPSELAEEDVMVVVQPREDVTINAAELAAFLQDKLPRYAQPRYIRIVNQLPKTETHRVIKHVLKKEGVTPDCWQAHRINVQTRQE